MRRQSKIVPIVLALTLGLAAPARSGQIGYKSHAEAKAALRAVLDNEWIEKLPYVTDLQPGWTGCGDESKGPTSVETTITVMTDTENHRALLEKQVPGSLEGFPVVVVVDRTDQYRLEGEKMMAKVQPVIDDHANKRFLRIPHVVGMQPSVVTTKFLEPITAVIDILVDNEKSIKEVQSKAPKTIGGFQTRIGVGGGNRGVCYTNTGKGCDPDDDVTVDTSNPPILSADDDDDDDGPPLDQRPRPPSDKK